MAKYGKENIRVYEFTCDSEAQALTDEVQQIAQLRADGIDLINLSTGGDSGATGASWTLSAETKARQSKAKMGNTNWLRSRRNTGMRASDATKAKFSELRKREWEKRKAKNNNNL